MGPPASGNGVQPSWEEEEEEEEVDDAAAGPSTEQVFEGEPVPAPSEMITARSVAVGVALGVVLSIVAMKLSLTSVYLPFLTIPAGLMSFFLSRWWMRLLYGCGVAQLPFTRQENAVIQTFVVSCTNIAYTGGFGSYILGMSRISAEDNGAAENSGRNVEEPQIARLLGFLFLTNFVGIFAILPFKNNLVIRHHLPFPTGTATAHLINSIHTPQGTKQASKQVSVIFKTLGGAMASSLWQWLFEGGVHCGFRSFPIFGITAARLGFSFDFSMTDIGIGLLSPYKVTISMLAGSLVSWGIMLPYITTKEGIWYPRGAGGINAYRWFIGIAMVLADGLCHLLFILLRTLRAMHRRRHLAAQPSMLVLGAGGRRPARSFDDRRRAQVFLRDRVSDPAAVAGYIALAGVSVVAIPFLYPQLRPTHVAVAYLAAPLFAFCNAYATGMTDVNLGPTHGKIAVLAFAWWVGVQDGGVVAGLAGGVIILSAVISASDLMQVFRTGYLTLTSPHTLLISQVAGTALGCMIHPLIFWILYGAYAGSDGAPVAPYATVYRGVALLSVSGKGVPKYSLLLSKVFFAVALAVSVLREVSARRGWRVGRYLPSTVAVAISLFMPPKVPIGMFIGSIVMYLWRRLDGDGARARLPAVAAGLICGDGLGSLLRSMLMLSRVRPPMCVMFMSPRTNERLDAILGTMMGTSSSQSSDDRIGRVVA